MKPDKLKADVAAWIAENSNAGHMRIIAERLLNSPDMTTAWKELAKHDMQGRQILGMVIRAAAAADKEMKRTLPPAEEAKSLRDVEKAAQELIAAIERAPLPDYDITEMNGSPMMFVWRANGASAEGWPWQKVNLPALLEYVAARLPSPPSRAVKRQRKDPALSAFVRHLAAEFKAACGKELLHTVAYIAQAVLDPSEPISKEQVTAILRP